MHRRCLEQFMKGLTKDATWRAAGDAKAGVQAHGDRPSGGCGVGEGWRHTMAIGGGKNMRALSRGLAGWTVAC